MKRLVLAVLLLGIALAAAVSWLGLRADPGDLSATSPLQPPTGIAATERGRYLVRVGDCMACHTRQGGADYAGGRAIPTPFGTFYSPNLTPDNETGLGEWSADDFWKALHEGRSRDGSLLYPSFPYTNYTRLTRDDSDAMFAYLKGLPPVSEPRREHRLEFPYNYRLLLVGWRALFFRPGVYQPDGARDAQWNRGAYLVQGLGHCSACHEARNALGAVQSRDNPAGGLVLNWYAPALAAPAEAGVQDWPQEEIVALLRDGVAPRASTLGPMAEVVYESLQHASAEDLGAMATYLKSLAPTRPPATRGVIQVRAQAVDHMAKRGAAIYTEHCANCHGEAGEGAPPMAPALRGNRAVTMESAVNPIRAILFGGYAPGTAGNPRPFGMPPFGSTLSNEQIADVLTYTRGAWGNQGRPVSAAEVGLNRQGPLW
ncbi:cytochrome c [Solimonas sp. K1W22B-7]|uniref:c-type cytochrome n=1 Tax=Solimonas sp. K1W22B-7 TaxID=2303331 RepID=UPI000E335047|nr:cytochrome c [Solimonas sp. K1W22B-7]AXQ29404.1 cytochrome c [Solimonas sp. K1W22B-7]